MAGDNSEYQLNFNVFPITPDILGCIRCSEIGNMIFSRVDAISSTRFQRTCRTAARAIKHFNTRAFNIEIYLSRFFLDPVAFRSLQERTGTVIGGSTALSFFDRSVHDGDNINLYVNPGHNYEVARHLVDNQGYEFRPTIDGDQDIAQLFERVDNNQRRESIYLATSIDGAHQFIRRKASGQVVEALIMSTARSPVHAILSTHSTAAMNLISSSCAVALYPRATFNGHNHKMTWNIANSREDGSLTTYEYTRRGYNTKSWISDEGCKDLLMSGKQRRVGDGNCWVITFETKKSENHSNMNALFQNSWKLVDAATSATMRFCVVSLPIFRYSYTVAASEAAAAMRDFYEAQWPHERAAREVNCLHQTWYVVGLSQVYMLTAAGGTVLYTILYAARSRLGNTSMTLVIAVAPL
ncbi:hypothetical protein HWV62_31819 [Athelia sp. TMB]|nr:hypothetical protein HWV62_31819 [Athelia sp. TMB]